MEFDTYEFMASQSKTGETLTSLKLEATQHEAAGDTVVRSSVDDGKNAGAEQYCEAPAFFALRRIRNHLS